MSNSCFKDNIKRFFTLNKWLILFIITLFFVGFLTGVFCTLKTSVKIDISFLQFFSLRNLLELKWSHLGFTLVQIMLCAIFILILYVLSFFRVSRLIFTVIFIYLSYILGIDCCVILTCFSALKGFLYALLLFITGFAILFLLMIYSYKISFFNRDYCLFGNSFIRNKEVFEILFLDPPYQEVRYSEIISLFINNKLLSEHAIIVIESNRDIDFPSDWYQRRKDYQYGEVKVIILWR